MGRSLNTQIQRDGIHCTTDEGKLFAIIKFDLDRGNYIEFTNKKEWMPDITFDHYNAAEYFVLAMYLEDAMRS